MNTIRAAIIAAALALGLAACSGDVSGTIAPAVTVAP